MYDWIDETTYKKGLIIIRDYDYYKEKQDKIIRIYEKAFAKFLKIKKEDSLLLTYSSLSLLDIYLKKKRISPDELFITITTAYWISSKFLFDYDIDINELSYLVRRSNKSLIDMERKILNTIDFILYSTIQKGLFKYLKIEEK